MKINGIIACDNIRKGTVGFDMKEQKFISIKMCTTKNIQSIFCKFRYLDWTNFIFLKLLNNELGI